MRCSCKPVFITSARATADGVTLDRALSVGCSCCGAPSGIACNLATGELVVDEDLPGSVELAENGKHPGVRWGDFCAHRLAWLTPPAAQGALQL